ncbi:MAG: orotidine-5'-phosphate decarboxylase [Candidatus Wildermuthbacteria bacterium]|nr:orotidine-5'-phosphate decarboxylase [Candidatus Wildermuthbacteria bacterium]
MGDRNFGELLAKREEAGLSVCVGLDSELGRIPKSIRGTHKDPREIIFSFNMAIVEATGDLAVAFKPNLGFYVAEGIMGLLALRETIGFIHDAYPQVPVILDGKFGDIGNTNAGYVKFAFDEMGADAVTLHGFLGAEALQPFLVCQNKGLFVLCRTSNPGAGEFQDLMVENPRGASMPLYQQVAVNVATEWNKRRNCGLVVGATYPQELAKVRQIVGEEMPILVPGIGAQGGELEATVYAGRGHMLINSSRGIIFASAGMNFHGAVRDAAQKLHDDIQAALAAVV